MFPNGDEEYVIWEPLLYADMLDNKVDFNKLFYQSPDLIKTPPLEVYVWLYNNPVIQQIRQTIESNDVTRQLLVGRRICFIASI